MNQSDMFTAEQVLDSYFIAGRVSKERKHVWLVAAPKSGSTWLTHVLMNLLGWQPLALPYGYHRREQEVDLRNLLLFPNQNIFSPHQHCRFSDQTRLFLDMFNVKVVLQGRDIFDTVVSYRDHLAREQIVPAAYVDESFHSLPPDKQIDFVIKFVLPWYFNFYCSWFSGRDHGHCNFTWVSYENLVRDSDSTINTVLSGIGENISGEQVAHALKEAASNPDSLNMNVGRIGRGKSMLSETQQDNIRELRTFYPGIDFSPIGL